MKKSTYSANILRSLRFGGVGRRPFGPEIGLSVVQILQLRRPVPAHMHSAEDQLQSAAPFEY